MSTKRPLPWKQAIAAVERERLRAFNYDESKHKRDSDGKWSSTGGGGKKGGDEKTSKGKGDPRKAIEKIQRQGDAADRARRGPDREPKKDGGANASEAVGTIAKRHLGIDLNAPREGAMVRNTEFHDLHVSTVKDGLVAAYAAGRGASAKSPVPPSHMKALEKIAKDTLKIDTMTPANRDADDFHELGNGNLHDALESAYKVGASKKRGHTKRAPKGDASDKGKTNYGLGKARVKRTPNGTMDEVVHRGKTYYPTGKTGKHMKTGEAGVEVRHYGPDGKGDSRMWVTEDGRISEDDTDNRPKPKPYSRIGDRITSFTDALPRNFKITSPEDGVWIVHDVPIFYETLRDGQHYDDAWLERAAANAFQAESDGHLPPMHVHHRFRADVKASPAGAIRVTGVKPTTYKGRKTRAVFANLIVTHASVAREIAEHRLMWRSPEVSFDEARIVSLALLDHEAPFFEGPMLTVESDVPTGNLHATAFEMVASADEPLVAFSRSGATSRFLYRDEDSPMPHPFEDDKPDENEQMGDAPGGVEGSGGSDAPGGQDKELPEGHKGEGAGATSFGDEEDEDEIPSGDEGEEGGEDFDLDDEGDEDLPPIDSENDMDGQREPLDPNGQPGQNPLLAAMKTTPATLEQSIEALGFLQQLVQKMRGGGMGGQPGTAPVPTEGPSDQMSDRNATTQFTKELAKRDTRIAALEARLEADAQKAKVTAFADAQVARLKGTTVGQRPTLHADLVAFADKYGMDAAQEYAKGLRANAVRVLPSGRPGGLEALAGDDVPDDLKPFQADGPEAYETARQAYVTFQELRSHGMCQGIDFKTFVERQGNSVAVPRHASA